MEEISARRQILEQRTPVSRVFGISGGALTALAFAFAYSAQNDPKRWGVACQLLWMIFINSCDKPAAHNCAAFNHNPWYGIHNLQPLRNWLTNQLRYYAQAALPVAREHRQVFLTFRRHSICVQWTAMGLFACLGLITLTSNFNTTLSRWGRLRAADLVDATIAALSTMLSTEPVLIADEWYRDCRPAIVNGAAIIADLQNSNPAA